MGSPAWRGVEGRGTLIRRGTPMGASPTGAPTVGPRPCCAHAEIATRAPAPNGAGAACNGNAGVSQECFLANRYS